MWIVSEIVVRVRITEVFRFHCYCFELLISQLFVEILLVTGISQTNTFYEPLYQFVALLNKYGFLFYLYFTKI